MGMMLHHSSVFLFGPNSTPITQPIINSLAQRTLLILRHLPEHIHKIVGGASARKDDDMTFVHAGKCDPASMILLKARRIILKKEGGT